MAEKKDVFISYSTRNSEEAALFCNILEGSGISCWIAPRDIPPGEDWGNNIIKGIEECRLVAFLVSEASAKSSEVAKEITIANGSGKNILQVRIENASLSGSLQYHLSNKQWVDALGDNRPSRFNASLDSIFALLDRKKITFSEDSVSGKTFKLVNDLNSRYCEYLELLNTNFSFRRSDKDESQIWICLPVKFASNGVDFVFSYNGGKRVMDIHCNAAYDGDPIKWPFTGFIKSRFSDFFPSFDRKGTRRWGFLNLVPETAIPESVIKTDISYNVFRLNIEEVSERVFPDMFKWAKYASDAVKLVNRLEDELKIIFQENDGWRVGAPEGSRMNDLRRWGKINVYKESWLPPTKDNYSNRGWLSITIESADHFLQNIFIGVLKHTEWYDIGDWDKKLHEKFRDVFGQKTASSQWWSCYIDLDEPWKNSGIAQATPRWEGKMDEFIFICIEKFRIIKENLESILDQACAEIPNFQKKRIDSFLPENYQYWSQAHLYKKNRARIIAETISEKAAQYGLESDFKYKPNILSVYLKLMVGEFDAVIAFMCDERKMHSELINLEPPDFETTIVKKYIEKKFAGTIYPSESVSDSCDGLTVPEWIDKFQIFVSEKIETFLPVFYSLKNHLENIASLTDQIAASISSVLGSEWVVNNLSKSLKKSEPINIYKKSWIPVWSQQGDIPPVMIQIIPDSPCFDDLYFVFSYFGEQTQDTGKLTGAVCGACDYAFGISSSGNNKGLWSKRIDEPYCITGGSRFDKELPGESERVVLLNYFSDLAEKIKKMGSVLQAVFENHKKSETVRFLREFWNGLYQAISGRYAKDRWKIIYSEEGEGYLSIERPEWNGLFNIGFGKFRGDSWIGVKCECSDNKIIESYELFKTELKSSDSKMCADTKNCPGWYRTGHKFNIDASIADIHPSRRKSVEIRYLNMMEDFVQKASPFIDRFFAPQKIDVTPNEVTAEEENYMEEEICQIEDGNCKVI